MVVVGRGVMVVGNIRTLCLNTFSSLAGRVNTSVSLITF